MMKAVVVRVAQGPQTLPQSYRYISNATRNDASTDPQRKKRYTLSVLHPEGANITFEFSDVYLHRFGLRLDRSQGSSPPSGKYSPVQCVGMIPSLSLTKKTIQVSQNKAYQWLLTYSESEKYPAIYTASGEPVSVLATQQMTTLSGPDAIVERVFHRVADWKEGAELWRVIKNTNGSIVSRTTKHWAKGRYYGDIFLPGSEAGIVKKAVRGLNLLKSAYSSRLAKEIIEADGSQYYTRFTDFNAYEIPQKTY